MGSELLVVTLSVQEYRADFNQTAFVVTPDDRRFVMVRGRGGETGELNFVQNFFEELKAKVGN